MARGTEGKQRRKAERKEARSADPAGLFEEAAFEEVKEDSDGEKSVTSDCCDNKTPKETFKDPFAEPLSSVPVPTAAKKKKKKRTMMTAEQMQQHAKKKEGIKMMPLIFLVLLTGTAMIPALLFVGDKAGAYFQRSHILGSLGHRLGIGPSPKKRVLSFYEKHDPSKVKDVPNILAKYYGNYPKLTKTLERKYQDYGYFQHWEQDEAPFTLAKEQLWSTYAYFNTKWNSHAPKPLKRAAKNAKGNFSRIYRKSRILWKKSVWPVLEPFLGVPKGGDKRKRDDRRKANNAKKRGRKDFIEEEDEM